LGKSQIKENMKTKVTAAITSIKTLSQKDETALDYTFAN
jgi:hypothetical protein